MEIHKELYNTKIKDRVKKLKEAKADYLYEWLSKIDKNILYERTKEFLLNEFQEVQYSKNTEIIKENQPSSNIMILKEGNFAISKKIIQPKTAYKSPLKAKLGKRQQIIMILGPNSIVGEDGFCFLQPSSYTLTCISPKCTILTIPTKKFQTRFGSLQSPLFEIFHKRQNLINSRVKLLEKFNESKTTEKRSGRRMDKISNL
jgi:CRP-like cAMP-binding protein